MRALCTALLVRRSNQELDHPKKYRVSSLIIFLVISLFTTVNDILSRCFPEKERERDGIRERVLIIPVDLFGGQIKYRYLFSRIRKCFKHLQTYACNLTVTAGRGKASSMKTISFWNVICVSLITRMFPITFSSLVPYAHTFTSEIWDIVITIRELRKK